MTISQPTESNIYETIDAIFDVVYKGGAVQIKAMRRRKEEITAYLLSHLAGVDVNKFYTGAFSSDEWTALREMSRRLNEMDIYFVETNEQTKKEKIVKVFTI